MQWYGTIAKPTGDVYKCMDPEKDEIVYFALQKGDMEFTIGMSDILQCIKFAEKEGEVPALPKEWWLALGMQYPCLREPTGIPNGSDEEI